MREFEQYHNLKTPANSFVIIRCDGRSFSKLTSQLRRPFDYEFHEAMKATARALYTDFGALVGETHSDEISILLPRDSDFFGRSVEKLVSVSAGICSAAFSQYILGVFDSRIIPIPTVADVRKYFEWRRFDAWRNCVGMYYHKYEGGQTPSLNRQQEALWQKHGINCNDLPTFNPITKQKVQVTRNEIVYV